MNLRQTCSILGTLVFVVSLLLLFFVVNLSPSVSVLVVLQVSCYGQYIFTPLEAQRRKQSFLCSIP